MTAQVKSFWRTVLRRESKPRQPPAAPAPAAGQQSGPTIDIAPNDPLLAYLQNASGAVETDRLKLDSAALTQLRAAGVKVTMPLVAQGELIGLMSLGPHLSEQDYTADDRTLLNNLASQAAPALRVAQLVRQRQLEAQERERMEHELQVAQLIQRTLLPRQVPELSGWQIGVYYQPARAVGGDFYDFVPLPDGRLVLVVGDVTDKGVPAALVMATTRAILRGSARRMLAPGEALARTNDLLCPDIPPAMFVTCWYAVLDPVSGTLQYANAGHDLPYWRHAGGVEELRATGMPLGLMPGMTYDDKQVTLACGDNVLFHSDGLVEAHNAKREMFGFPRLRQFVNDHCEGGCPDLIKSLLAELATHTGAGWEQEDDITLLTLERLVSPPALEIRQGTGQEAGEGETWRSLADFTLPSISGNEAEAMRQVEAAIQDLRLPKLRRERLKTAVSEATMNAIEHGNQNRPDLTVSIQVTASDKELVVRITDHGGGRPIPPAEAPDLEAKLAGLQSPRGWGLFLIEKMVDEMRVTSDDIHHTIELVMHLGGEAQ